MRKIISVIVLITIIAASLASVFSASAAAEKPATPTVYMTLDQSTGKDRIKIWLRNAVGCGAIEMKFYYYNWDSGKTENIHNDFESLELGEGIKAISNEVGVNYYETSFNEKRYIRDMGTFAYVQLFDIPAKTKAKIDTSDLEFAILNSKYSLSRGMIKICATLFFSKGKEYKSNSTICFNSNYSGNCSSHPTLIAAESAQATALTKSVHNTYCPVCKKIISTSEKGVPAYLSIVRLNYSGKAQSMRYYVANSFGDIISSAEYRILKNGNLIQPGRYKFIADFSGSSKYKGYLSSTVYISRVIYFSLPEKEYVYTGSPVTPAVTAVFENGEKCPADLMTITYCNNDSLGVGKMRIAVTKTGYYSSPAGCDYVCTTGISFSYNIVLGTPSLTPSVTASTVKLSWNKIAGATGYQVYRYNATEKKYEKLTTTRALTYTDTGRTAGTKYTYKVRAYAKVDGKTVYGSFAALSATTTPAAPSVKTAVTASSVKLSWNKVTGAAGYQVYRYNPSTKAYEKLTSTTSTSYTDSKRTAGTSYQYKIRAYVKNGKAYSYSGFTQVSAITQPAAVAVTAAQTTSAVTLTFSKTAGASGYEVYRYNSSTKKYDKLAETTGLTYKDASLNAGTKYTYKVRAFTKNGSSTVYGADTVLATATKTATPKTPAVTAGTKQAAVKWTAVSGASGYQIQYGTSSSFSGAKTVKTTGSAKTIGSLTAGKTYYFRIRAYVTVDGKDICSAWSSAKSVKIK